jgi:predicted AlkP superfamily pyrophosphatase or phosphodiesterase
LATELRLSKLVLDHPFVRPAYDHNSFLELPNSIAGLLGHAPKTALAHNLSSVFGTEFDRVLLILVDGFGWRFVEQYSGYPILRRFTDKGVARKICAQFPSTTAAHITTLHTGLEVGQHGVFEWQYYEPQVDALIAPLMFSYAGTRTRDELKRHRVDSRTLLPTRTLYHDLASLGIRTAIFQHREYTPSTYSNILLDGAGVSPYTTFPELLTNLRAVLASPQSPQYLVAYFDRLDFVSHHYGPGSQHCEAEADGFLLALERQLFAKLGPTGRTLVILTADHGSTETDPATTIYLNVEREFTGLERFLRRNGRGAVLAPAGSPRDLFLYVHDELIEEAQAFLKERLAGRAQVVRVADLIAEGFFGAHPPSPAFLARAGNLVILAYPKEAVWWYEKDRHEQRFFGHHGGLTPQEMEVPLLALVV